MVKGAGWGTYIIVVVFTALGASRRMGYCWSDKMEIAQSGSSEPDVPFLTHSLVPSNNELSYKAVWLTQPVVR